MSRFGNCPICFQRVTVPEGLDPESRVRCPLCGAEFPLSEIPRDSGESEVSTFLAQLEALHAESTEEASPSAPPELVPVAESPTEAEKFLSDIEEPAESKESSSMPAMEGEEESQDFNIAEEEMAEEEAVEPEEPRSEGEEESQDLNIAEEEAVEPEEPRSEGEEETEGGATEASESPAEPIPESQEGLILEEPRGEGEQTAEETGEVLAEHPPEETAEEVSEAAKPEEAPTEEAPPLDLDPLVRAPGGVEPFPLSQLMVEATGEPIGPAAAALIVRHGLLGPISEEEAAELAPPEPSLTEGDGGGEAAGGFDFRVLSAQEEGATAGVPISARPRKRAEVNPVKEMIGIVLGGAAGLLIGYYLLNIFGGARFDFLQIYLPGVKHTYKYAPPWVPEWAKGGSLAAGSEESDQQPPAPNEKKNNRAGSSKSKTLPPGSSGSAAEKEAGPQPGSPPPPAPQPPAAKPQEKPAGKPSVSVKGNPLLELAGAPSYTSDDLGKAFREVLEVFGCRQCNSTGKVTKTVVEVQEVQGERKEVSKPILVPCEACKGQPSKVITEESYPRFCHLAEVLSFVSGPEDQGQLADRKLAIRSLLEQAAEEPANAEKIGPWADELLKDAGRLSQGILLSGKLGPVRQQGPWQQYELQLAGTDQKVPLLAQVSLPAAEGDTLFVLGCIVEDPSTTLRGYTENQPLVIVSSLAVKAP